MMPIAAATNKIVSRTTPPGTHVVLYDGMCVFCTAQVKKLLKLARPGAVQALDFQDPAVLARFPGITHEACMKAMQLVTPDGYVFRGFEAAVRAVATRPVLGKLAYLYYVPGVRQLCDAAYAWIAARRYRLMGKAVQRGECAAGTCALHARSR
jgi:predicted DCC family thiol-disulfide oxidoreductase YuxK